ncbi:hypothetical protein C7H19_22740 [Aphanothece hegewaldii CCALA 016]|uniref:Uncharacterized protein n=1 Tax=Aphanothece hegewaldii CCALA 016 TaxID=2107694 RepID=A0A2T1LRU3_9CHRO|nr:hypothetical protein [Aphanothece hegewaldii]PSF31398.1 hypothetical protein C7H19_22740 [Aphanothece hegewaldii CCALA 016]
MIIHDLEHLKCISVKNDSDLSYILGSSGITIAPPIINLFALVNASSFPSSVDLSFSGDVIASETSILKVFSGVFVRAISPL